jgi:hypothetical protein
MGACLNWQKKKKVRPECSLIADKTNLKDDSKIRTQLSDVGEVESY